jgi:hypothetical protein
MSKRNSEEDRMDEMKEWNTVCIWDFEALKEIYALWFWPTSREGC